MQKRNLFVEIAEGFDALANGRAEMLGREVEFVMPSETPSLAETSSPVSSSFGGRCEGSLQHNH